ncbi:MAG: dihydropteroate synthase, partial [Phycisphaerae bacterium]
MHTANRPLRLGGRTRIMGVLNVTPDSFSDGGRYGDPTAAVAQARRLAADGGDLIDVGGESTRPGSDPVPPDEQVHRVVPVIRGIRDAGIELPISIDTQSAEVAAAALDAGADLVNDISALRGDPAMAGLCAQRGAAVVLMHMQGSPDTMQEQPTYDDVVHEVRDFLMERVAFAERMGIPRDRIIIDPGIGFGKSVAHNLQLLRRVSVFVDTKLPVLIGASRKSFLGAV